MKKHWELKIGIPLVFIGFIVFFASFEGGVTAAYDGVGVDGTYLIWETLYQFTLPSVIAFIIGVFLIRKGMKSYGGTGRVAK